MPRIRVMRKNTAATTTSEVHVSAVIGDLIEQFRSTITPMAVESDGAAYDKFDSRVFFQELVPDREPRMLRPDGRGEALHVGLRHDHERPCGGGGACGLAGPLNGHCTAPRASQERRRRRRGRRAAVAAS